MARAATTPLDGQGGIDPAGSTLIVGPSKLRLESIAAEEVAGRLLCAEEELQAAHRACLGADEKFAHEVAQMVFAVGAIRLSWRKKHGI